MLEMEIVRNDKVIAQEINEIKKEVEGAIINGAIEIGKRLCEVKQMIPVGSWGAWLHDNIDYSERTAQNMMAVYNEYGKKGVPEGLRNASLTNALAMIGLPEDVRHQLIDEGAPEEMSTRELKKRIAELEAEREKAQMTIDGLLEDKQEAETQARTVERDANRQAERVKELLKATEAEKEDLRQAAIDAETRALQQAEELAQLKRERGDMERRLKEAEQAVRMEPAVIEKDSQETLDKIKELEERLQAKGESEGMILFRAGWDRFVKAFCECVELIKRVESDDGPGKAKQLREALAASARQMAGQLEGRN